MCLYVYIVKILSCCTKPKYVIIISLSNAILFLKLKNVKVMYTVYHIVDLKYLIKTKMIYQCFLLFISVYV